ncbi:response regulator [Stutzerimonas tarimensis]|uniref:Response regulator n=1 Tax=Stutzerimonas tarimensis TaxID=1507735 RepID=A0ABV7TB46_9GAMM
MSYPTHLLLIDDHALLRRGLAELLNAEAEFTVVGQAGSGEEGLALARQLSPQLILLDLHLPRLSGLDTLTQLRAALPDALVVVLTASDCPDDLMAALRNGADGYILKDSEPERLLDCLRNCHRGQVTLDPGLARLPDPQPTSPPLLQRDEPELTERERQTLMLIAEGLSNKLIARQLGISDGTVKIYVKHLLSKLQLHSRLELAAWAHRGGFVERLGARMPSTLE